MWRVCGASSLMAQGYVGALAPGGLVGPVENFAAGFRFSGMVRAMSYRDLPPDLSTICLDDPTIAADVIDLILDPDDREIGSIGIMLCDAAGHGLQPVVVGDLPRDLEPERLGWDLEPILTVVAEHDGKVILGRGRPGGLLLTDDDRAWHQAVLDLCEHVQVPLIGCYLASPSGVRAFPLHLARAAS